MGNFLSVALVAQLLNVAAQDNQFCHPINPNAIKRMASMPQGQYAAWWPEFYEDKSLGHSKLYAAVMCSTSINRIENGGNCIVDLETGKVSRAPGWYDGQWVKDPDSQGVFTIPNKYSVRKGEALPGLTFFRHKDVIEKGAAAAPLFNDPGFGNHYHSIGLLEKGVDTNGRPYAINRVVNDKWGVSLKDYKFILSPSGDVESIQAVGPERNLTNSGGDTESARTAPIGIADQSPHQSYFDLPMISRDGKFFAANNRKTMTTQIYEITQTGKRLVADLGFETGKVSFAPRRGNAGDLYIAFHIDQIDPAEGDKMTGVHPGMTKDIVVMRLTEKQDLSGQIIFEPGQMVRVTLSGHMGDGNYYPKWINEKEFVFIESSNNNRQTFIKVNVDGLNFNNNVVPRPFSLMTPKQYAASSTLGYYVATACTEFPQKLSAKEAALYSMNLTKENCQKIASNFQHWKDDVHYPKEFFTLRNPKAPGAQRVSGYNFHESASKRGSERFEMVLDNQVASGLSEADLTAVCSLL